jgi:hypothetical protein
MDHCPSLSAFVAADAATRRGRDRHAYAFALAALREAAVSRMRWRDLLLGDVATRPDYAVAPASQPEPPMRVPEWHTGEVEVLVIRPSSGGRALRSGP